MITTSWKRDLIRGYPWTDDSEIDRMDRELACEACGLLMERTRGIEPEFELSPAGELALEHVVDREHSYE